MGGAAGGGAEVPRCTAWAPSPTCPRGKGSERVRAAPHGSLRASRRNPASQQTFPGSPSQPRSQQMVRSPHFNDGRSGGETQGAQGTGSPSPLSRKDISWEKTSWKNLETVDIGLRSSVLRGCPLQGRVLATSLASAHQMTVTTKTVPYGAKCHRGGRRTKSPKPLSQP